MEMVEVLALVKMLEVHVRRTCTVEVMEMLEVHALLKMLKYMHC